MPVSPTLSINEKAKNLRSSGKQVYHFGFGQSPFPIPQPIVDSLIKHASAKDYLPSQGAIELRSSISAFLNRFLTPTTNYDAENILITPGSKQALYEIFDVFNGDVLLPSPSWVSYKPQCSLLRKPVHIVDTSIETGWHITAATLERICSTLGNGNKLLLINSPCNPTGQVYNKDEIESLAPLLERYNVYLLADEIYASLQFEGEYTSVSSVYERTIITSGISKHVGAGGWRLGYAALPHSMMSMMPSLVSVASETFSAASAPVQMAAITAFQKNDEVEEILRKQRSILAGIGGYVADVLRDAGISVLPPKGGFYMFPDWTEHHQKLLGRGIVDSNALTDAILKGG